MAGRGGAGLVSRLPAGARLPNCLEPTHQQLPGRGQLAPAPAPASSKFHRGSPPSQSQGDGHPVSRATPPYKCSHGAHGGCTTKPCPLQTTANMARSQCESFLHQVTIDMRECFCHHCTVLLALAAAVLSKSFLHHAAMADGWRGESNGTYTPPCFIPTRMLLYSDYLVSR